MVLLSNLTLSDLILARIRPIEVNNSLSIDLLKIICKLWCRGFKEFLLIEFSASFYAYNISRLEMALEFHFSRLFQKLRFKKHIIFPEHDLILIVFFQKLNDWFSISSYVAKTNVAIFRTYFLPVNDIINLIIC